MLYGSSSEYDDSDEDLDYEEEVIDSDKRLPLVKESREILDYCEISCIFVLCKK